ncbi:MAG: hypothetical protein JWP14_2070 [Frankiales bacterium]|jgi:hypothetical protein|nr:hypothetical protein [Frankiales bacterium]
MVEVCWTSLGRSSLWTRLPLDVGDAAAQVTAELLGLRG